MYSLRPKVHVLNFFTDSDDGSALTVLVNGVRFHIIADPSDLGSSCEAYMRLLADVKAVAEAQTAKDEGKNGASTDMEEDAEEDRWCTCRQPEEGRRMIACESDDCTYQWFHFDCVGVESAPEAEWFCPNCSKESDRQHSRSQHVETTPASDSGIDVDSPKRKAKDVDINSSDKQPEQKLQDWMLLSFGPIFSQLAPREEAPEQQSLAQWYAPQTFFYNLQHQDSQLEAVELHETDDLNTRMGYLIPKLPMPKYITNLDMPWHNVSDLMVLEESDALGPLHPSRVQAGDEAHFIKIVDDAQPDATKREIKMLKRIEKLGLHKQFHVPQVLGLVGFSDSEKEIMGFLQTDIPDPTPLTCMLDSDVPQKKRDKWAAESKRIVDLLHDNDLVFGDCKADNFLVDKYENLWIIDFGGSYTDGWIDPELAETEEGDDMGIEKIVNALHDPEANTFDDEEEEEENEAKRRKRKRGSEETAERPAKACKA